MSKSILIIVLSAFGILCLSAWGNFPTPPLTLEDDSNNGAQKVPQHLSNVIFISGTDDVKSDPQIAYNSKHNEYLVVWERVSDPEPGIYGQRLNARGERIGAVPIQIAVGSKRRKSPAVDYDPVQDRYLVVWEHDHDGSALEWDISGRFVPWGSNPTLAEFKISSLTGLQLSPKVAYNANKKEFLVTWQHYPTTVKGEIMGSRLKADGSGFINQNIKFTGEIKDLQYKYDLVYNLFRNEYLLVWSKLSAATKHDVYMTRFKYDGGLLSAKETPLAVSNESEQEPDAAVWLSKNGYNGYLVIWKAQDSNAKYKLEGAFYAYELTPYAGLLHIKSSTNDRIIQPTAVSNHNQDQILVVWTEQSYHDPRVTSIWGRYIDLDQSLGPDFQISVTRQDTGSLLRRVPSTAAGGKTNFLAAWEHSRSSTEWWDIHASLLSRYSSYLPITMRN